MATMGVTRTLLGLFVVLAGFGRAPAQEPKPTEPYKAASPRDKPGKETPEQAARRLVEQIRRHPAKPSKAEKRFALYLINVGDSGELTRVADQPDPVSPARALPAWSFDGQRILFDATPWTEWSLTRLKAIELVEGRLAIHGPRARQLPDVLAQAGDRIAFLNNSTVGGAEPGVWIMNADGSQRRLLGEYGRPKWSPDSRQFMIVSFSNPCQVTLMDVRPERSGVLTVTGQNIFPVPSWAGTGTIAAVMGSDVGDTIALIDVNNPAEGRVKEILWKRANGTDLIPSYPLYSAITRRCIFVGSGPKGMALYWFQVGEVRTAETARAGGIRQRDCGSDDVAGRPVRPVLQRPVRPAAACSTIRRESDAAQGKERRTYRRKARTPGQDLRHPDFETSAGYTDRHRPDRPVRRTRSSTRIRTRPRFRRTKVSVAYQARRTREPSGSRSAEGRRAQGRSSIWAMGRRAHPPWVSDGKQIIVSPGHMPEGADILAGFSRPYGSTRRQGPRGTGDPPRGRRSRLLLRRPMDPDRLSRPSRLAALRHATRRENSVGLPGGQPVFRPVLTRRPRCPMPTTAGGESGIWVVDVDGTHGRQVSPLEFKEHASACWSPDGKRIAIILGNHLGAQVAAGDAKAFRVVVMDLDGGRRSEFFISDGRASDMPDWR